VKINQDVSRLPVTIAGTVTQCVISIQFTPNSTTGEKQLLIEQPDGKLLLKINDSLALAVYYSSG
jgi:hypothetical protein